MDQLHLQLYAKSTNSDFDERLSTFRTVTLGTEPAFVELSLDAPAGEELTEVRIDPDDKPSSFVLHHLKVRSSDGRDLYAWNGDPAALGTLVDLQASKGPDGIILQSFSDDPFLLIPLGRPEAIGVVLEMAVSLRLATAPIASSAGELAEAVRSLQSSLRFSIDDLADQQEGLQEAIVVHQAHSRRETATLKDQLSDVLDRTQSAQNQFDRRAAALGTSLRELATTTEKGRDQMSAQVRELATTTKKSREEIFAEVRDDWRSVSRQISDTADTASRQRRELSAELLSTMLAEIAVLTRAVHRLAGAQDAMQDIRRELDVTKDEDAVPALKRLRTDADRSRTQLQVLQSTLSWRLTRPFRTLIALFRDPRTP